MPIKVRRGEDSRLWFRSERIYQCNGLWYFNTREGVDVGPYVTRADAEIESDLLKNRLRNTPDVYALRTIREFILESRAVGLEFDLRTLSPGDYVVTEGFPAAVA